MTVVLCVCCFLVPVPDLRQNQIILEVSGLTSPPAPLVRRAQAGNVRADCMAGETRWRDRMGD
jgi:hypothetical protein